MGYSSDSYRRVKDGLRASRERAEAEALARRDELHAQNQEIKTVDRALSDTGMRIFRAALRGGEEGKRELESLREENAAMLELRSKLLRVAGYPADYTEPHYACSDCHDSGYIGTSMCHCMKQALVLEGFRESGIGRLIEKQSFENFDLEYYRGNADSAKVMALTLERARAYAEGLFTPSAPCSNLLFVGATGLGKTHLSTAIARRVIERGYDVRYESAPNILGDFETERFGGDRWENRGPSATDKYFNCDLLIIDDLGTEMINQFTLSCLYNLINTRQNRGLPMLISTNLTQGDLRTRYNDRITSRILGEFDVLLFVGKDNRGRR